MLNVMVTLLSHGGISANIHPPLSALLRTFLAMVVGLGPSDFSSLAPITGRDRGIRPMIPTTGRLPQCTRELYRLVLWPILLR